jgi:hypothetical protein
MRLFMHGFIVMLNLIQHLESILDPVSTLKVS